MAHKKKCVNCGHKVEVKDGELIHTSPHPHHICKCENPIPFDKKVELKQRKVNRVQAGMSTYSGYTIKEFNGDD